ncbi:hypothetical protein [Serratia sp. Nf2]|uniref:hypothetical protein n=1 Tax=Serratia sp. Nf2 TaxID=2116540 RepID=UPI000D160199|nr:hypothetical protein [Serratia sp. Nf2]PTA75365.1 hypothetical protein C9411_19925 [Serratia sp. Nf2]
MTLTTEQLNDFAGVFRKDAARWVESGEPEIALELHALADELDALAANREAQPVEWGAPKTVGQMIGQLKTLDPAMETTALLRMPPDILDGNAVRQVPISISFEKLNGQWLAPYKGEGRKVLAFWAKADHREETERGELFTAPPAPATPDGFKLVPTVPTPEMIAAAMNCDDVTFNADETFCVNFGNIYAAMLAAAPEGGNG